MLQKNLLFPKDLIPDWKLLRCPPAKHKPYNVLYYKTATLGPLSPKQHLRNKPYVDLLNTQHQTMM